MIESLKHRWQHFAKVNILPRSEEVWNSLASLYSESSRYYHNFSHIQDCLTKLDCWPKNTQKNVIELALWLHCSIYDSRRNDNAESSASLASYFLKGHPLEAEACSLILLKDQFGQQAHLREQIFCDIELSILGAITKGKYSNYARNIRQEYAWTSDGKYCEARARTLEKLLKRDELFQTAYAKGRWGKQARINIQEEIQLLQKGKTF